MSCIVPLNPCCCVDRFCSKPSAVLRRMGACEVHDARGTVQWDVFLSCKVGRSLQHNRRRADLGIARCWLSCSWTTIGYLAREEFGRRCNSRLTGQPRCWTSTVIYGLAAPTSQLGSLRNTRYTDNASMYIESRESMGRNTIIDDESKRILKIQRNAAR